MAPIGHKQPFVSLPQFVMWAPYSPFREGERCQCRTLRISGGIDSPAAWFENPEGELLGVMEANVAGSAVTY
jgi:hypothetical protein